MRQTKRISSHIEKYSPKEIFNIRNTVTVNIFQSQGSLKPEIFVKDLQLTLIGKQNVAIFRNTGIARKVQTKRDSLSG